MGEAFVGDAVAVVVEPVAACAFDAVRADVRIVVVAVAAELGPSIAIGIPRRILDVVGEPAAGQEREEKGEEQDLVEFHDASVVYCCVVSAALGGPILSDWGL